jgi:hypothetical protein
VPHERCQDDLDTARALFTEAMGGPTLWSERRAAWALLQDAKAAMRLGGELPAEPQFDSSGRRSLRVRLAEAQAMAATALDPSERAKASSALNRAQAEMDGYLAARRIAVEQYARREQLERERLKRLETLGTVPTRIAAEQLGGLADAQPLRRRERSCRVQNRAGSARHSTNPH